MKLHIERDGAGSPPMVLVHGFTQTSACWGEVAAGFARHHEVVRVDAPGHGESAEVTADLWTGADLLAEVVAEIGLRPSGSGDEAGSGAVFVGYSMGGRFALHTAVAHPSAIRALVLVGATGGIDDPKTRAARAARDEAQALEIERQGVDAFLETWLAQPLFATLPESATFRDARKANTAAGLAGCLRLAGTGSQEPLWALLPELPMPVLAVAGSLDAKFRAEAERLAATIGERASVALVEGAGHAAHLEQPESFVAAVEDWLSSVIG